MLGTGATRRGMRIVRDQGTPVVEDPARLDGVTAVGVDETTFLVAAPTHHTEFATGVTDLTPGRPARLLDLARGWSGTVLSRWLAARDHAWRGQVSTASLDPLRGYASALAAELPAARRGLDPFHGLRLGLDAVDQVRRRVQQDTHGHRGRSADPLYGIRRMLRRRTDRLFERAWQRLELGLAGGDPAGKVACAWSIAQDLRDCYERTDPRCGPARP